MFATQNARCQREAKLSLMRVGGLGCKAKQRRKVQREVENAGEAGERWIGSSAVAILSWIAGLGCSLRAVIYFRGLSTVII